MSEKSDKLSDKFSTGSSTVLNYNITISDLQELMKYRGQKGIEELNTSYGGITNLYTLLNTTPEYGITSINISQLQYRRNLFGKNSIEPPKPKKFFDLILIALSDPILIFLEIGGIFSICVSIFQNYYEKIHENDDPSYDWIEGVAIIISVFIIVVVTAATDYQKEKQFRNLQEQLNTEHKIPVLRNGIINDIPIKELVVGDICLIKYGNSVPADGIIIQSNDLKIDESALTGESDLVKKDIYTDCMVLSGTYVMEGSGKILITAVGIYSQNGIILTLLGLNNDDDDDNGDISKRQSKRLSKDKNKIHNDISNKPVNSNISSISIKPIDVGKDKSILQIKLLKLAFNISKAAFIIAILLVIILLLEFIYDFITENKEWNSNCANIIIQYILTGISILVIAIPEGLPLAVTLSLAYSVKKMTYDNNLVRNLAACETMGNATIICSDKTGTLTTNRMTCVEIYTCEKLYKKIPNIERIPQICGHLIIDCIAINSLYTSRLKISHNVNNKPVVTQQIGNKTECALLGLVNDFNHNYELIRMQHPENEFIHIYTFNSKRKSMSTIIKLKDNIYRLYTKGASELIMLKCNYIFDVNGKVELFTDIMKINMNNKIIIPMANDGYRTVTLAYRDLKFNEPIQDNELLLNESPNWNDEEYYVNDLTLICVCAIKDPVRPEVPNAIRLCQSAGISVRMVTGDNLTTAKSIALKCGIINLYDNNYLIMEGKEFNNAIHDSDGKFNQNKFDRIWPTLLILARSSPLDKYVLVKGIIDSQISPNREVVAVTGDGTNDGPALKIADVGFAMGIAGTDVAKEASDIIITDDNFSSIVKAVMWGRNIYDSIAKFIQFQLTVNLVAVTIACVSSVVTKHSVLKAVQLLWVNLIMDSLASLALATEKPTEKILKRKPYGRTKSIISAQMLTNIILQSIYQLIVLAIVLLYFHKLLNIPNGSKNNKPSAHYTLVFNTLVMMTLFNEINSRKLHGEINIFEGLFSNIIFLLIWFITLISQIIIVQYGGYVFYTAPLNIIEWFWCILFGIGTIIWSLIYNRLPIKYYIGDIYMKCLKHNNNKKKNNNLYRSSTDDDIKNLWVRSSKRLSNQLNVLNALNRRNDSFSSAKRSDSTKSDRISIASFKRN